MVGVQKRNANSIREYVKSEYILSAKNSRSYPVSVGVGEVHAELNLKQRLPAVCAAIGADRFSTLAGVKRLLIDGPLNGASTTFTFCWCGNHKVDVTKR